MGVVKNLLGSVSKVTSGVLGGIAGLALGKASGGGASAAKKTTASTTTTTSAADEEEQRRKRLLALNASGNNGQLTPAGGDTSTAPISRKTLLGQ